MRIAAGRLLIGVAMLVPFARGLASCGDDTFSSASEDAGGMGDGGAVDGPSDDAAVPPDAGAADAARPCTADAYDFCDNFEGARSLQDKWGGYGQSGTGSLRIDAGTLLGELHRLDGGPVPFAVLSLNVPWTVTSTGARRRVLIQFRARIDVCPAAGMPAVGLALVGLPTTTIGLEIREQAGDCIVIVEEAESTDAGPVFRYSGTALAPPIGAWGDYELELTEAPANAGGQVNVKVGANTLTYALPVLPTPTVYYQNFGVQQGSLDGVEARVALDDFRVDYLK